MFDTRHSHLNADAPQLASAAVRLARAAIELLDLRQHAASHPRLGVVDHISLQPAGLDSPPQAAAEVARAIGVLAMLVDCTVTVDGSHKPCSTIQTTPLVMAPKVAAALCIGR